MNKSQAIEAIKNATKAISLLFYEADQNFAAVKIKDGDTDVSVEGEYAKGTKVSVSSSTGSIPAPDAKYSLSNGKNFSTKGGVIDEVMADDSADSTDEDFSEVEAPAIEATEPTEVEAATESAIVEPEAVKVEEAEKVDAVKELTDKVSALEEAFNKIKEAFATKEDMKAIGESFKAIKSAFDVLSDTPAEFSKVDKSVLAKEEKAKKLDALASLMMK